MFDPCNKTKCSTVTSSLTIGALRVRKRSRAELCVNDERAPSIPTLSPGSAYFPATCKGCQRDTRFFYLICIQVLCLSQFLSLKLLNKRARVRLSPGPLNLDVLPGRASLFAVSNSKGWFAAITQSSDTRRGTRSISWHEETS
jgi:hypothetical protein